MNENSKKYGKEVADEAQSLAQQLERSGINRSSSDSSADELDPDLLRDLSDLLKNDRTHRSAIQQGMKLVGDTNSVRRKKPGESFTSS